MGGCVILQEFLRNFVKNGWCQQCVSFSLSNNGAVVCVGGQGLPLLLWEKSPVACSHFLAHQTAFFRQHGCTANDANTKYNSRAAQMYREKIRQLGSAALARHGTDVSACSLGLGSLGEWVYSESCVSVVSSSF